MEAYPAAELLPRLVSPAHTQGLPSSSSSPSPLLQQAARKHLPIKGAFSECPVQGFSSSSTHRKHLLRAASASPSSSPSSPPTTSKHLPRRAFSDCHIHGSTHYVNRKHLLRAFSDYWVQVSPSYFSSFSPSSTQQATCKHLPRRAISDCQVQGSSSSPTQHFKRKHFPRAFSERQAQKITSSSSSSSSRQHVNRKRLARAFSDFQVQGFPSSPSRQHVRRKHLPRAFSDFLTSTSSPSFTRQNMKRKHLPRAFIDYPTQKFSSLSSTRMHLPKAFSNHRTRLGFKLAEQQQPPTLSVRTTASVGGLSGAVHGSNSRKGRHHKRTHQGNNQDLENSDGKEIVGDNDSRMFCDDVPYDEDSDSYIYCNGVPYDTDGHMFSDDVPYDKDYYYIYRKDVPCIDENFDSNCAGSLISRTYMYDSIHGDFWQNDPYYQEFERLENEMARQEQVPDGSTPDRSTDISIVSEQNLVEILDVASSRTNEYFTAVQGGNSAAIAYESMDISESRFATATKSLPAPFKDTYKSVKDPFSFNSLKESTVQDLVGTLEADQHCSLDPEKSLSHQDERGKDKVREVRGGERPSANLGSLQNVEGTYLESRQCSGNGEVDGTDLESRSFTEAAVNGVVGSVENTNTSNVGASVDSAMIIEESDNLVTEVVALADAHTLPVVEQVQVAELISDSIKEQVVNVVEKLPAQVSQVAEQVMLKVVDQVAEVLPDPIVEQVSQVAEQVTQTAEQIVEQVANQLVEPISTTASQIVNLLSSDEGDEISDDEFEAYSSLDIPEFKGYQGLSNFTILQEQGVISVVYDFYIFMLKRSPFEFMLGMFAAPILLSVIFTILYLPQFNGLALDETVREFLQNSDVNAKEGLSGLQLSWETVFQVFMFSVSLSTGLQPELAPLSPYTLVVANLNALFAQLIFVFLSGAVFARLSQPSQPVKFSTIAIICPPPSNRRLRKEACHKALLTRYVLVGPQPCELVDVKVDLTYNYNTVTRSGTYFRTSQSLKLMYRGGAQVRPEVAFLNKGMVVRHIIDETSPLYRRTPAMLEKEDAVFSLSVVGLERSSMQSVFHIHHYCVYDNDVVWDAEFEDMILISKKNKRVVDHSLLSKWKAVVSGRQ